MERFGDFFPENPESLDELLEIMAQRMAAMQAMLNSMTPEQRAQLQGLANQLLEDMDLRWQMDQLSQNLQQAFPDLPWNRRYDFEGQDPLGFAEAAQVHVGKAITLDVKAASKDEAVSRARQMCDKLLANPVTEDYLVEVEEA